MEAEEGDEEEEEGLEFTRSASTSKPRSKGKGKERAIEEEEEEESGQSHHQTHKQLQTDVGIPMEKIRGRREKEGLLGKGDYDSDSDTAIATEAPLLTTKPTKGASKWSLFRSQPRRSGNGKKYKRTGVSKCALCIGVAGGVVLVTAVIAGGGVMVLGKKPVVRSEGWYPTPVGGQLSTWQDSYKKAHTLVSTLSLPAKVNLTTGTGWSQGFCVGNTGPAYSLDGSTLLFPSLCLQDGPLGLRFADNATAWPAGITVGATWNRELMRERGKLHGREARGKGVNVILGPAMGPLGRMPAGGRNWEGFGADPWLQGVAASETIKGIQSEGVIATAKHYIFNEQEHFRQANEWGTRQAISANVDDRTLHELYLWPFADSVRAGVGSIMCSYQQTNNTYSCGNSKLLNGILKDELGFQGFVQSDWLAERNGVEAVLSGLDMTMPGDGVTWADGLSLLGPHLTRAVLNTTIPLERLNDMATRIVAAYYEVNQDKHFGLDKNPPNFSSWTREEIGLIYFGSGEGRKGVVNKFVQVQEDHGDVARKVAAEANVLVKNTDGILPLKRGEEAWKGKKVGIYGEDAGPGKGMNFCENRGCNQGTLASGWGSGAVEFPYLVTPLEALSRSFNSTPSSYSASSPTITSILTNDNLASISASAAAQDLCLVFINSDAGEGFMADLGVRGDRNDLFAQKDGDNLVLAVADKCANTVVVIHSVGPVVVERWADHENVKAIVYSHLPGQESGNALVDVLFGDVNPSGKLPYTVGKSLEDYGEGAKVLYYPNGVVPQQDFKEGLYIDYRWFDKKNIAPRYEFGYGLSYTTFTLHSPTITLPRPLSSLSPLPPPPPALLAAPQYPTALPPPSEALFPSHITRVKKYIYPYLTSLADVVKAPYTYPRDYHTPRGRSAAGGAEGGNPALFDEVIAVVAVDVANAGPVAGKEVVQLYVGMPAGILDPAGNPVDFPVRVLRGFDKVHLDKGATRTVRFALTRRDLSFWCVVRQNWVLPTEKQGGFTVWVGTSSRRLPVELKF